MGVTMRAYHPGAGAATYSFDDTGEQAHPAVLIVFLATPWISAAHHLGTRIKR